MTENKRFWSEDYSVGYYTEIVDNDKELTDVPNPKKNLTIEEVVDLLNELNDENQQIKKEYNSLQRTAYKIDAIAYEDREYSERLYKQNQQLEKEIHKLQCINKQLEKKYEENGFSLAYDMEECE